MSKESEFFLYLLERYSYYKNKSSKEVLSQWDRFNITALIYDMYEIYHIERLQNAFDDIDGLIKENSDKYE